MHEDLKEEGIVNKVGGRFKLSTLIQKRMIMLNTGAKPLVDLRGADKMAIVIQEILQDKIYLDASGEVQARLSAGEMARQAMMGDVSGDLGGVGLHPFGQALQSTPKEADSVPGEKIDSHAATPFHSALYS